MAKPSERNRMMRDIAGVAMDEELTVFRQVGVSCLVMYFFRV